ncbi:MAG: class I SAM-dependent methyltransferase [Dongiaceae bacterium]
MISRRAKTTLSAAYFDAKYSIDPDPWNFNASAYEAEKYAATLGALPDDAYGNALELGCSIGVFTQQLAGRCRKLTAVDISDLALDAARKRCAHLEHVQFLCMTAPAAWPDGQFDLILLSEVLYYFDLPDLKAVAKRVRQSLLPGGTVILVHWTGTTDYPLSGDVAADSFIAEMDDIALVSRQLSTEKYRLDVLRRKVEPGR